MSIIKQDFENSLTFSVTYQVTQKEYEDFKERLIEQLRKSYKKHGYRDGHVPMDIYLKDNDMSKITQTIQQETAMRYTGEAIKSAKKILAEKGRVAIDFNIPIGGDNSGESEEGFYFTVICLLLPEMDLKGISKIKLKEVSENDIEGKIEFSDFLEREHTNLLTQVNEICKKEKKEEYENIQEAVANFEDLKKQFKDKQGLDDFLKNVYETQIQGVIRDLTQIQLRDEIMKSVPDFDLPEARVNSEVARIVSVLQSESEKNNINLDQAYKSSGLPNPKNISPKNIVELTGLVDDYVKSEFKLTYILREVYETMVEEKIEENQIDELTEKIKASPASYNMAPGQEDLAYNSRAFDLMMRTKAAEKIETMIKG